MLKKLMMITLLGGLLLASIGTVLAQGLVEYAIIIIYADAPVQIEDLNGNVVGEGVHGGEVRCDGNNCSQSTNLTWTVPLTDWLEIEYNFTTRQAVDPDAGSVVVAGTGVLSTLDQTERFEFVATFQDNRDGTVAATYDASLPDASVRIPRASGRIEFGRR